MTTRSQGPAILRKNRDSVKECLQKAIDNGQEVFDNPKENGGYRSWVLMQRRALLIQFKESYETVYQQVLSSVEKEAVTAARTDEQISTLLGKEQTDHYPIILEAQGMLSTLNALKEKMEAEKLQSDAEEDRNFLVEERQRKIRIEDEERAWKAQMEEDDRRHKTQSDKEESDRKHALAMKQLKIQELSDKRRQETEYERLQVVRETGGQVDLDVSRRSTYSPSNRISAKLPQLEIPKFRGDKLKWIEFDSIFKATINDNVSVSEVEKFSYLSTLLQGDAEDVIRGFPLTAEGYQTAYKLLEEKYGDTQVITDTLIAQICSLRGPSDTVGDLRSFYDAVEGNLRALEARGKDVAGNDTLRLMIQEKLPKTVRMTLEMFKDDTQMWSLPLLRKSLLKQIQHRENIEGVMTLTESREDSRFPRHGNQGALRSSVQNLQTGSNSWRSNKPPPCPFCKGEHFGSDCAQFPDLESRKAKAQERKLCWICLRGTHEISDCYSKDRECWYCGLLRHHQSLCPSKFGEGTEGTETSVSNTTESGGAFSALGSTVREDGQPWRSWKKDVVMQTAWTTVREPGIDPNSRTTRVILDCASDRSYISSELAGKLGVKPLTMEMLSIETLHQKNRAMTFESPVVEFEIKLKDDSYLKIVASVISPVVGRIRRFPVDMEKWGSFFPHDNTMADSIPDSKEWATAELLIGGDYYEDFVLEGKKPIGDSGLFLTSSKLGTLLTGATKAKDPTEAKTQMVMGYYSVSHNSRNLP